MEEHKIVSPELYDRNYYLTDNEGCREYAKGLDDHMHAKYVRALRLADPRPGQSVLDIGCGRGELVYYCAKRGARAFGIDYSAAAIDIARQTLQRLPSTAQAGADLGDVVTYPFKEQFDAIFMIDIVEHMYDWQLTEAFARIHKILKPGGRLIITTPNDYFERILLPAKRIFNLPFMPAKWGLRVLRGKYQPKSFGEFWSKCFRVRVDRASIAQTHVNVLTPPRLRTLLKDFQADVRCEDHSVNPLSLMTQKWWGREIVAVATKIS